MVGIIILMYIALVLGVIYLLHRLGFGWPCKILIFLILLFAPLWEQLLGKSLMWEFSMSHGPLQEITKTVQKPGSALWIDNVWPGFDGYARELMVKSYLDGVRLKVIAMNDGKGKLYVYRAKPEDFAESESMRPAVQKALEEYQAAKIRAGRTTKEVVRYQKIWSKKNRPFRYQRKQEAELILKRPEVYPFANQVLPKSLPPFNYRIEWNQIPLSKFRADRIWCDKVEVTNIKTNQKIGFTKRCLQYSPRLTIKYKGGDTFEGGAKIGDLYTYNFDDKVLFGYAKWQIVDSSFESKRSYLDRGGHNRGFLNWKKSRTIKENE